MYLHEYYGSALLPSLTFACFPTFPVDSANSYSVLSFNSSFLKRPLAPNIPIQAIGLSLYESLPTTKAHDTAIEAPGTRVTRTQWLDLSSLEMRNLVGKNILIVDEVDDTRTTLEYAVRELRKDVEAARQRLRKEGEEAAETRFFVFVLHVSVFGRTLHFFTTMGF